MSSSGVEIESAILAVLITFVLSFVDVSIALGESLLRLDLGDSTVAVLVAALIGLAPWRATAFLAQLADRLFDWLAGLAGGRDAAAK